MQIDNLKKVALEVTYQGPFQVDTGNDEAISLAFIFGIGRQGLTPLESELHQRGNGDVITVPHSRFSESHYFGHLYPLFCKTLHLLKAPAHSSLSISVSGISTPKNREVVEALAGSVAHGCSGEGCDCGCG